jgi:hypothetical protein
MNSQNRALEAGVSVILTKACLPDELEVTSLAKPAA